MKSAMKLAIATTTINPPTKGIMAMLKLAKSNNWQFIIAGDKKTPHQEYLDIAAVEDCVTYLHPNNQEDTSQQLSDLIGWNCIQRRNFSLIEAYNTGAEVIALWDDDNIPYSNWGQSVKVNQETTPVLFKTNAAVFDPLCSIFPAIWHRGFPHQILDDRQYGRAPMKKIKCLVQADFWDGSPDVDAVCRIALNPQVEFKKFMSAFSSDKPMPFNSQNTFISRDLLPTYFLFPHIGRMDDIWASYYTQAHFPESVIFSKATVKQERNEHDLVKDLEDEMIGYKHSLKLVEALFDGTPKTDADREEILKSFIPPESFLAYEVYKTLISGLKTTSPPK